MFALVLQLHEGVYVLPRKFNLLFFCLTQKLEKLCVCASEPKLDFFSKCRHFLKNGCTDFKNSRAI